MTNERTSGVWVVALSQHVETRRVSPGQTVAMMLIGPLVTAALTFPFFARLQ